MDVEVQYSGRAEKGKKTLSSKAQAVLVVLEQHLRETDGKPFGRGWSNLGILEKLGKNVMHCHLTRREVAIWSLIEEIRKGLGKLNVCRFLYLGSREKAPY